MNCKEYIFQNLDKLQFKNEIISSHPKNIYDDFIIEKKYISSENKAFINLEEVLGTDHPDYESKTWLEALSALKRQDINLNSIICTKQNINSEVRQKNLNFYNSSADVKRELGGDDPWSADIYIINNRTETYITQGNNRTIVAKFLFELNLISKIIPVTRYVTIKKIDTTALKLFNNLLQTFQTDLRSNKIYIELKRIEQYNNDKESTLFDLKILVTYMEPYDKWKKAEYSLYEAEQKIKNELQNRMNFLKRLFLKFKAT